MATRLAAALAMLAACAGGPDAQDPGDRQDERAGLRIAQFNIRELSTAKLLDDDSPQVKAASEVIARFRSDILCLNEIQYDLAGVPDAGLPGDPGQPLPEAVAIDGDPAGNANRLASRIAEVAPDLAYDHSALFLGNSGVAFAGDTDDELFQMRGFGEFPGQFNTAVLSRLPIRFDQIRVISDFPWRALPGNRIAEMEAALDITVPDDFPLFEKGVHIVPVELDTGELLHLVLLHPVSSGFNDLNPFRNGDELAALAMFLSGELPDVEPLPEDALFVVVGDLNSDPEDGESPGSVAAVFDHDRVIAHFPVGDGGEAGTNPEHNTFLSGCGREGQPIVTNPKSKLQLQLDYLLPSVTLGKPLASGVFWPHHEKAPDDYALACRASDHRYVFIDVPAP